MNIMQEIGKLFKLLKKILWELRPLFKKTCHPNEQAYGWETIFLNYHFLFTLDNCCHDFHFLLHMKRKGCQDYIFLMKSYDKLKSCHNFSAKSSF